MQRASSVEKQHWIGGKSKSIASCLTSPTYIRDHQCHTWICFCLWIQTLSSNDVLILFQTSASNRSVARIESVLRVEPSFFFICGGAIIDQRSLLVGHIFIKTLLKTSTTPRVLPSHDCWDHQFGLLRFIGVCFMLYDQVLHHGKKHPTLTEWKSTCGVRQIWSESLNSREECYSSFFSSWERCKRTWYM